jgi:hypothetical protein
VIVKVEGRREKLRRLEQELEQELQGQQQLLAQQLDTLKQTRDQLAHMKKLSLVSHFPCYCKLWNLNFPTHPPFVKFHYDYHSPCAAYYIILKSAVSAVLLVGNWGLMQRGRLS